MLSDEEKKAIEYLKIEYEKLMKEDNILFPLYKSDAKRLIDIIEKQSKEIEELKGTLKCTQNSWYEDAKIVDKIKAKIEDILNSENSEAIEKLIEWQSLLEKE